MCHICYIFKNYIFLPRANVCIFVAQASQGQGVNLGWFDSQWHGCDWWCSITRSSERVSGSWLSCALFSCCYEFWHIKNYCSFFNTFKHPSSNLLVPFRTHNSVLHVTSKLPSKLIPTNILILSSWNKGQYNKKWLGESIIWTLFHTSEYYLF